MENNELIKQVLSELLHKTSEKKINWNRINPSAFRWVKKDGSILTTTTLQKQMVKLTNTIASTYILTIQNSTTGAPIQISSSNDNSIDQILANIFSEAEKVSSQAEIEKQAEIIRNLLKDL